MRRVFFCSLGYFTLLSIFSVIQAQDCTINGREAGLEPIDRANDTIDPSDVERLYIMSSQGGISCYGVLTRWSFYKSTACDEIKFQVYRPDDPAAPSQYTLIGENTYDPGIENCKPVEQKVDFYVPYLQQIPFQPGDIIAWIQLRPNPSTDPYMIKYDENVPDDVIYYDNCDVNVGDQLGLCGAQSTVDRAYSLQAQLKQGPRPTVSNLNKTIDLSEDEAVGNVVYIVYAQHISNSLDSNVIPHAVPLTFSLDPTVTAFAISETGVGTINDVYEGTIKVELALDYDQQSVYSIPVVVEGLGVSTTGILTINIIQANEPHTIINLPDSIDISAATVKAGDPIFQVELNRSTSNPFPMVYYIEEISPYNPPSHPHPPFVIDSTTGLVSCLIDLEEWWEVATYSVDISVTDGVHKDGPHTLTINILDLRPAPTINNLDAAIDMKEDAVGGTMVFKVEVTSRSDPSTYEFSLGDYNNHFYIDSRTGEIWLSNPNTLDYSVAAQRTHDLKVNMKDDFQSAVTRTLTINVEWVNQPPQYAPAEYWISIPEGCNLLGNCAIGNPPVSTLPWLLDDLDINGEDRDADNNIPTSGPDQITCEILPGFASDFFQFQTTPDPCKKIDQIKSIDVDGSPQYMSINLSLAIRDNDPLVNSGKVYITVYDINDNAPRFNPNSYSAEIYENTPGGVSLLTVSATDRDSGINAEFRYSLEAIIGANNLDGTRYFEVDPLTGVLSTKHPVDYEALAVYHKYVVFNAVAKDKGEIPNGPLSGSARVNITIEDVNDNAPQFLCSSKPGLDEPVDPEYPCFYNMEVKSITLNGTFVWQLAATDVDVSTPTAKFYKLVPESDFALNYDSGIITTATEKLNNNYKYVIYALSTDEGVPELISTPSVVRIESYSMSEYAVDVTVKITDSTPTNPCGSFDQDEFLRATRDYVTDEVEREWFVKREDLQTGCENDRVVVIIYALRDNSTFLYDNLENRKHFVPTRYELLKPLRKTILGKPSDEYKDFMADRDFDVILVMPWRQIWLIDTLAGLIVLLLMMIMFVAFWIALGVYCCKRAGVCCFKKKPPVEHAWLKPESAAPQPRRRPSIDTVHSLIYEPPGDSTLLWPN